MLKWFKTNSIKIDEAAKLAPEQSTGAIVVGEFVNTVKPTLIENVYSMVEKARTTDEED
jgi:hypothetical protein